MAVACAVIGLLCSLVGGALVWALSPIVALLLSPLIGSTAVFLIGLMIAYGSKGGVSAAREGRTASAEAAG